MDKKNNRFKALHAMPHLARLDHRLLQNSEGEIELFKSLSRNERRKMEKETTKVVNCYKKLFNQLTNAKVCFLVDKLLKDLVIEYNHRFASSGVYNQPVNFNYFEPFCSIKLFPKTVAPHIIPLEEFDHLFYLSDFLDFAKSSNASPFELNDLFKIPEQKTFHFTVNGNIKELEFFDIEHRQYIVSGFSMVRHGNFLYWYIVAGEIFSKNAWEALIAEERKLAIENVPSEKRKFLEISLKENDYEMGAPISLEGIDFCQKTILAGEFDLISKRHVSRCMLAEYENSFLAYCDDPMVLSPIKKESQKQILIENMMQKIDKTSVLWNLAEFFFQLPSYFNYKLALNKELVNKTKKPLYNKKGGEGIGKEFKIVTSIEVKDSIPTATILEVKLPHYEIETEGFWKKLNFNDFGRDKHGNEVKGKTWVKEKIPWKQSSKALRTVYVKDKVSSAKLTLEEYFFASNQLQKVEASSEEMAPELYVMRCTAMEDLVFKVGFTTIGATKRAKQLSRATGVPESFIVVKTWKHSDAKKLETEVHMMLAPYRINDRREFFRIEFSVIEETIETILKRIEV